MPDVRCLICGVIAKPLHDVQESMSRTRRYRVRAGMAFIGNLAVGNLAGQVLLSGLRYLAELFPDISGRKKLPDRKKCQKAQKL